MDHTESEAGGVVEGCNQPDYSAINLPSKDRADYNWRERRAELLQLIEEAGPPAPFLALVTEDSEPGQRL